MKRKITYPNAGNYGIAFNYFLENCGYEVVVPPSLDRKTLDIGVKNAPSQSCVSFKITLGNILQGIDMGADTVMMLGARGDVCRVAYFNDMYRKIASDKGIHVELLDLHPQKNLWTTVKKHCPEIHLKDFIKYCYGFWLKMELIELLRAESLAKRPFEIERGASTRLLKEMTKQMEQIDTIREMKEFKLEIVNRFNSIPLDHSKKVMKIGLVGETFLLVDQFSTLNLEEYLGELGVMVTPTFGFTKFFLATSKHIGFLDKFLPTMRNKGKKIAQPYLNHPIGGRVMPVIAETISLKKRGYDAVIHIYPFSCMPHIVGDSIFKKISKEYDIPTISLAFDEHTSEAGVKTRLEAFVDMVRLQDKFKKIN